MSARRLRLTVVASLCGLACVLGAGVVPALAGATQFGEPGHRAGQLSGMAGLGLDRETGDVYVPEFSDERVSKFDGSGNFLFAWGWGVNNTSPADELQTCTAVTGCRQGSSGTGAGEFASTCGAEGVAVDNDPLSGSYRDVYVVDFCSHRVQKFGPSGNFLLTFGGHVNAITGGNVCVLGESCKEGTQGTANGEFEWANNVASYIAVGPGGAVYVGDRARVEVFEPSGAWRENVSLTGLSSTGKVTALAVDSTGDMFVKDGDNRFEREGAVPGVREFGPNGTEKLTQFDAGSESVEAITLDAKGDLFVADSTGGFHVLKYDPAGKELESFGSKTAAGTKGIVFSDALGELYVSNVSSSFSSVWVLTPPPPGPLVEAGSESAIPGQRGHATLEARVNPEGSETTYRFEYVDQAHFQASGYASASSTPVVSIGSGFEDQLASVLLTGLVPAATYHYRIAATNSNGTATGVDGVFTTVAPALVEGPWVANVAGTSATLAARVDPLGASTEYRLEYGTSTSYGQVLSGSVGEGESYVLVSFHRQDLQLGTVYHYRLVTVNEVGTVEGADHVFTTQVVGGELTLPDGRAWELVSPANKEGALIEPLGSSTEAEMQAAAAGNAISYATSQSMGEKPEGKTYLSQILSTRGGHGWRSEDVEIPYSLPKEEGEGAIALFNSLPEYHLFSQDLSSVVIEPHSALFSPSPEAKERTLYLRDNANGTYVPLVSENNVPPGTKYAGSADSGEGGGLHFLAATPDLNHVVFESYGGEALTPEAKAGVNLYEWSGGRLQLVNVLPDGETESGVLPQGSLLTVHVMSSDGRWIVWRNVSGSHTLYVRDMVDRKTVEVGGDNSPSFQTMSSDGSRIFFLEKGDLYEFNVDNGIRTDLTANHGAEESNAGVRELVLGASEDGSYVYFVAKGVLASGAVRGEDNLYVLHDTGSGWTITHVATLSSEDEKDWYAPGGEGYVDLHNVTSRVSPDGRFVTFMSDRSLTGYDNVDAVSGQRDQEVYLYDGVTGRLSCASCDPTGARPVGARYPGLLDPTTSVYGNQWLAGSIPGWEAAAGGGGRGQGATIGYQQRYLSDSGRLFFDSPDALVPQDTNGLEDVYEYEPAGVGGCTSSSVTFSEGSDGCVNLVSSGISSRESAFLDASENGDDVFFLTASRLTGADYDTGYDVYDAHACSGEVPCVVESVSSPPCTSGDSCKAAPSPQPEIFGPAPSATFSGTGNVVISPSNGVVSSKSLTRAQRLSRALRACRKDGSRRKRVVCERQARRRYRATQSRNAKATTRGHR
jgi:hypothetical protein